MVPFIRKRVLDGELMLGIGCVLGSSLTAEMAGKAGFDWLWLDMEHGSYDYMALLYQVQAVCATGAAPVVRVRWNEPPLCKRVLDLGVSMGIPNRPEDARFVGALERVVAACRASGKAAGIMLPREDLLEAYVRMGFTCIVAGSDAGFVMAGLGRLRDRAAPLRPERGPREPR